MNERFDRILFWIRLLALLAVVVSVVLLYEHVRLAAGLDGKSFCNISQTINCDAVSQSKWSRMLGFPLAGYGFGFYLCVFVIGLIGAGGRLLPFRIAGDLLFTLALFSVLFALYLFSISAFVIGSFCILCASLYVINALFFVLALKLDRERSLTQRVAGGFEALIGFLPRCVSCSGSKEGDSRMHLWLGLTGLLVIAGLTFALPDLIAMKVVLPKLESQQEALVMESAIESWQNADETEVSFVSRGLERDYSKGSDSAPITVMEFSDLECPACRKFYLDFEELAARFPGKIKLIFKNFPLDNDCNPLIDRKFHESACYAAMFTRCAGEQGRFWEALDYLFRLPELDSGSASEARGAIASSGAALGLDREALKECLDSRRHAKKLSADSREGEVLGVEGTPSIWVNGRKVEVASISVLEKIFREILKKQ